MLPSHPDVLEATATGGPSELTEEDVKFWVVIRPGTGLYCRALHDHCAQTAPMHMVPRYYEVVPSLPKAPTQKVEKFRLPADGITAGTWDAAAG